MGYLSTQIGRRYYQSEQVTKPWTIRMLLSYLDINNHVEFDADQKTAILDRLNEDYVVNTFGPDGLDKSVCDFFIFFENDETEDPLVEGVTTKSGATLRWNYGDGNVYSQNNLPGEINNGVISVTSTDGFSGVTVWEIYYRHMTGFLFNVAYYCPNITSLKFGGNDFTGAIPPLPVSLTNINLLDNDFTGSMFDLSGFINLKYLDIYRNRQLIGDINAMSGTVDKYDFLENMISELSLTNFSTILTMLRVSSNRVPTTVLETLLSNMLAYYTANAPTKNTTLSINGVLNGFIDEASSDLADLKQQWTDESKTLTVNYNKLGPLSKGMVALTFDDVMQSIYTIALPVMKAKGVQGTVFMTIEYIDTYNGTYDEYGCTWDQLKGFISEGWTVGSHSYYHIHLADADEPTIRANMADSKAAFVAEGMTPPDHFAYPYGSYDALVLSVIPDYFASGRIASIVNMATKKTNEFEMSCLNIDELDSIPWETLKEHIDFANANNCGLVLLTHTVYNTYSQPRSISAEYLAQIIDYISTLDNCDLVTIDELYNDMKT